MMEENHLEAIPIVPQLKSYHVSEITGFLLEFPLTDLPEYFSPWMKIGKAAGSLLEKHKLRDEVDKMPLLDADRLHGHKQLRLANLMLSIMTSGYVWQEGDKGISTKVPKQLAIPMCYISDKLGIPKIATHIGLCAANWQLIDPNGPVELSNLATISGVAGGFHCSWFFLVTAQVELCAVPGIKAIPAAQEGVVLGQREVIQSALNDMTTSLKNTRKTMTRMFENLSSETFYSVVRPYLAGWGGAGSPAPDGIIFEGVSERPQKAIGGNAAQSPPLQCFDAVLNIHHPPERQHFLDLMREYMLPAHKAFIEAVRAGPSVRKFVMEQNCNSLREAYNTTVDALKSLRTFHIQLTTRYIVIPASKMKTDTYKSVSKKGTGNTEVIPFLKSIRDSTGTFRIQPNPGTLNMWISSIKST